MRLYGEECARFWEPNRGGKSPARQPVAGKQWKKRSKLKPDLVVLDLDEEREMWQWTSPSPLDRALRIQPDLGCPCWPRAQIRSQNSECCAHVQGQRDRARRDPRWGLLPTHR